MSKTLILYYSRKGENYSNGKIVNLTKGNTEVVAEFIQKATGADIFEVESQKIYPADYHACTIEAKSELSSGTRVEVKNFKADVESYDTIFVGYPNWWGTMPMVMFTFLEHYDLSGKTIIPFCTNEGSGMGRSHKDLQKICPNSQIKQGLAIHGSNAVQSESAVRNWLDQVL